jgi:membrane protein implicated in regulation of membrane protease activity
MTIPPKEIIWLIVGIIFVFSEFFIPGVVIAFFGIGGIITAGTTWVGLTPNLSSQLLVFTLSSLLLLFTLRRTLKPIFLGKTRISTGNKNFNIEIGKLVGVVELIEPNELGGKVRYQGAPWSAKATEQIVPGETVKIIGCTNLTLLVEKVNKTNENIKEEI